MYIADSSKWNSLKGSRKYHLPIHKKFRENNLFLNNHISETKLPLLSHYISIINWCAGNVDLPVGRGALACSIAAFLSQAGVFWTFENSARPEAPAGPATSLPSQTDLNAENSIPPSS